MITYTLTPDTLSIADSYQRVTLRGPVHAFWAREEQRALSRDWTDALDVIHHATAAGLTCEDAPSKRKRAVKAPIVETPVGSQYVLASAVKVLPTAHELALFASQGVLYAGTFTSDGVDDTIQHAYQIGAWPSASLVALAQLDAPSVRVLRKIVDAIKARALAIALDEHNLIHVNGQKVVANQAPLPIVFPLEHKRDVSALVNARELGEALRIAVERASESKRPSNATENVWIHSFKGRVRIVATSGHALSVRSTATVKGADYSEPFCNSSTPLDSIVPLEWCDSIAKTLLALDKGAIVELSQGDTSLALVAPGFRALTALDPSAWTERMRETVAEYLARETHSAIVDVNADNLRDALKRALIAVQPDYLGRKPEHKRTMFTVNDGGDLKLVTESPACVVTETLECVQSRVLTEGDWSFAQCFDPAKLAKIMRRMEGENVRLHFAKDAPVILTSGETTELLMAMGA